MASTAVHVFQTTLDETHQWLEELAERLNLDDHHRAYNALRAVLQTIRDRLTVEEATDFASQLPLLVRGFYYEGWNPSHTPAKEKTQEDFLSAVRDRINERAVDPQEAVIAVAQLLRSHVTAGQLNHVVGMMPAEVKELF
ncbi:MAG: DUF2267 domain-containing protein [Planctomycetes bacterium]|nr:DUF2267 domain-containing protein [Planctomycetota bacterium]